MSSEYASALNAMEYLIVRETCRLCGAEGELQESHIVPAFVFRWLKDTSATGYLRFGQVPNRRVQDGPTRRWLCATCEQRFNVWETRFATEMFHPLNADGGRFCQYRDWLLKFCASISWRNLVRARDDTELNDLSADQMSSVDRALSVWSEFVLGRVPHPGKFQQHLLPLDTVDGYSAGRLPANINRYILRTVEMDVIHSPDATFTFSKIGKFIVLGFIDITFPNQWVNTRVHVREGIIRPSRYTVPRQFGDYLLERTDRLAAVHSEISATQRDKISQTMMRDLDRLSTSDSLKAMEHDVELSGDEAFKIHQGKANS
jgi:hypothetical protein